MSEGQHYAVNDIYESIQGEGAMTGVPMAILRMQGCDVGCPWCDTKETWTLNLKYRVDLMFDALGRDDKWCMMTSSGIADWINKNHPTMGWVLLTGGEPAQQNLAALVGRLQAEGLKVLVETSGTAQGVLGCRVDWLCVSPKLRMPGGKEIIPEVLAIADEIKMPIGRQKDIDELLKLLCDDSPVEPGAVVSLQPLSESKEATRLCVEAAKQNAWRVSIQVHKLVDLP